MKYDNMFLVIDVAFTINIHFTFMQKSNLFAFTLQYIYIYWNVLD